MSGQAQGFLSKSFYERRSVGMPYLSDSILVIVNCSKITRKKQEELFMPSRDRLADTTFRISIERELEDIIKNHSGLKDLQNRRRKEAISDKLQDSKPLADVLENIIKKSPTLSSLFMKGIRIKNPFNMEGAAKQEKFVGKLVPSYFKLVKNYTKDGPKLCHINHKFRIQYETDAENDYFNRDKEPGELILVCNGEPIKDYSLNLWNGLATLTIGFPEGLKIGDIICFATEVNDVYRSKPFVSEFCIKAAEDVETHGSDGARKKPTSDKKGNDRQKESYLDLPNVINIRKEDWGSYEYKEFKFGEFSALKVRGAGEGGGYDFYVNMDNSYLKTELKGETKTDPTILEARYRYGMVLLGISIIDFEENRLETKLDDSASVSPTVNEKVSMLTEAVAPVLLPMIASLGSSEFEA